MYIAPEHWVAQSFCP